MVKPRLTYAFETVLIDFAHDKNVDKYVSIQYQPDYDSAPWIVTVTVGEAFIMQRFLLEDDAFKLYREFKKEFEKG